MMVGGAKHWGQNAPFVNIGPGASARYALRRINSNYRGYCIRVRRASDNAELDVGFIGNELNTNGLMSWIGVGDTVFVKVWYDQSGNGKDLLETTVANQPRIITGGVIETKHGKPCIFFDPSVDMYFTRESHFDFTPDMIKDLSWSSVAYAYANTGSKGVSNQTNLARAIWTDSGSFSHVWMTFYDDGASVHQFAVGQQSDTTHITIPLVSFPAEGVWTARVGLTLPAGHNAAISQNGSSGIEVVGTLASTSVGNQAFVGDGNFRVADTRFDGWIGELYFWNTPIVAGDLNDVGASVAARFGQTWNNV